MLRIRLKGMNLYATATRSQHSGWYVVMLDDGRTLDLHRSSFDVIAQG